jgi:hypothetical protein
VGHVVADLPDLVEAGDEGLAVEVPAQRSQQSGFSSSFS